MKNLFTLFLILSSISLNAQFSISGKLVDIKKIPIGFANVALYSLDSNQLVKVEISDTDGSFLINNIQIGAYSLQVSFIGFEPYKKDEVLIIDSNIDLGELTLNLAIGQLEEAVVKARRTMVEVKPDRMVFNVEGTINSAGDNALGLLRKAPAVVVDNNNNISVLSRSGVKIYIDGKPLPLGGDQLKAYLESLPAEQIDRIDIITNPGAKYEAEGNAGIIDIRLKKSKDAGANGSINGSITQGHKTRGNLDVGGNFRNKKLNIFATLGTSQGEKTESMQFFNHQNGLLTEENNDGIYGNKGINYRVGTDFFIAKNHTIGFLLSGHNSTGDNSLDHKIIISKDEAPIVIDSILIAKNASKKYRNSSTTNLNYVYDNKKTTFNIDLDYGKYDMSESYNQPNRYYDSKLEKLLSENITEYETPVKIDIYTAKFDFETDFLNGKLGVGSKLSQVKTENTYLFYNIINQAKKRNDQRSNQFLYDETVIAEYISYSKSLSEKINFAGGLRVETTKSTGDLKAFDPSKNEEPVKFNYTNYFPNIGFTYQINPMNLVSINYGRRINRPDYEVLNPFEIQLSELSFLKGNAFLNPEIVNNFELGYTLNYRYNFKLGYSKTTDQITRLIGPDSDDKRAGYITWQNLAEQKVYSLNISLPTTITKWWDGYFNLSGAYINNQADYGEGAIVDIQAFTYSFYQQQTFKLKKGFVGEISGYFAGPGIWGGVFKYNSSWSLNLGLQKKFLQEKLNIKISANDVFDQAGWSGTSSFNGLVASGSGNWDSQRISLSMSYHFGNSKIKSRKRKTGIEEELDRLGK